MNYGVIIGRFQVADLHTGHQQLFKEVESRHNRVIVFLAVSRTIPTSRNPLDFETRRAMIQQRYPHYIVLPIRDEKSDEVWSAKLDDKITEITGHSHVVLYGGRDSFLPHYKGKFKTQNLLISGGGSAVGTAQRKQIASQILDTVDFRAGAIYAVSNQYPRAMMTVDIAILHQGENGEIGVLLGKKPNERGYRFVGGFVEPGETLEKAAKREAYEETNLDLSGLQYIRSFSIDDWRYRKDPDAHITTALFSAWSMTLGGKPGDDIEIITWFDIKTLPVLEGEHQQLANAVKFMLGIQINEAISSESVDAIHL